MKKPILVSIILFNFKHPLKALMLEASTTPVNTTTSGRRQYDVRHVAVIDVVCSSARQRADVGPMRRGVGPTSGRHRVPTSSCLLDPPKNCTFPWRDLGRHQKMVPPKMVPWAHQSPYPKHLRPTLCGVCAPAAPQICTYKTAS